jgi:hypothetical protein
MHAGQTHTFSRLINIEAGFMKLETASQKILEKRRHIPVDVDMVIPWAKSA